MKRKKSRKPTVLIIFLVFLTFNVIAQKDNYIPPSPESATLSKSLNFPAGTHTGVPSISVPLYNVEAASLSLPIALSYHAGGFRINEQAGPCGLGWSMSILELQVSRQVNGLDDFGPLGYYSNNFGPWSPHEPDVQTRIKLSRSELDHQPDRFSFRLLDKSGTFYFHKSVSGVTPVPLTIPAEDVVIQPLNISNPMQGFKITDADGTVYVFNVIETTTTNYGMEQTEVSETLNTSWKCSQILNAQRTDTVYFDYVPKGKKHFSYSHQERIEVWDQTSGNSESRIFPDDINDTYAEDVLDNTSLYHFASPKYKVFSAGRGDSFHILWCTSPPAIQTEDGWKCLTGTNCDDCASGEECINDQCTADHTPGVPCPDIPMDFKYPARTPWGANQSATAITGVALDKIRFRTGEISFLYETADKLHLASIRVSNYQNAIVKNIDFGMKLTRDLSNGGQYLGSDGTRFLKTLKIDYTEKYSFTYDHESFWFSNHMKGSDAWGGVNLSTTDFSGDVSVPLSKLYSLDQQCKENNFIDYWVGNTTIEPDANRMKYGILTGITYPSGGKTEFIFSPNQYKKNNGQIANAGGLRIDEIRYYEGRSADYVLRKIYEYGENEDGTGILHSVPSTSYATGESSYIYEQTQYYGELVTERKRTIVPNAITDLSYSSGAPVHYIQVAEYTEEGGILTGKKLYQYDQDPYSNYNASYRVDGTNLTVNETDWHQGKLKAEVYCKFISGIDGSGNYYESFDTVKIKRFHYEEFETGHVYTGKVFLKSLGKSDPPVGGQEDVPPPYLTISDFTYKKSALRGGNKRLLKEEEVWKENGQKLIQLTAYTYSTNSGSARMQPVAISTTLSNGITETRTAYAFDYSSTEGFLGKLKARYMTALPVEQVTLMHGQVVSGQFNEYRNDSTGLVHKVFILETDKPIPVNQFKFSNTGTFTRDTRYKERSSMTYGNGLKPVMVATPDNIPGSYIWGYRNSLPVAKVTNARHDQVYFNGFEDDASATHQEADSHTGVKYKSGSFQVQFTPATSGTYYMSYWYYSNQSWQWSGELPYSSGQTITANRIDDVRVYPKGALMATYTYKPLVGITSLTDASNITSYYHYDAIGRLETIKDSKGNILKTYTYHYRQ